MRGTHVLKHICQILSACHCQPTVLYIATTTEHCYFTLLWPCRINAQRHCTNPTQIASRQMQKLSAQRFYQYDANSEATVLRIKQPSCDQLVPQNRHERWWRSLAHARAHPFALPSWLYAPRPCTPPHSYVRPCNELSLYAPARAPGPLAQAQRTANASARPTSASPVHSPPAIAAAPMPISATPQAQSAHPYSFHAISTH
jgi:hypothetical protein